jgi:Tfp pilus assembly protein PilV
MDHVSTRRTRAHSRLSWAVLLAVLAALAATLLGPASPASAVTKLTDAQAASQLSAAGITRTSSGGCTNRNVSTCTSYEQINQSTGSGIITYKNASGCAVNITGGTEVGHAAGTYSHYNGYKVDISRSTCNDSWITGHYSYIGLRGDGYPQYQAASGNVYVNEGSHWDITYYTCGC